MGSPGTYQATLMQLFIANGLTPIKIPQNPDAGKIFGILPGEKCQPDDNRINTEIDQPNKQK